MAAWHLWTSLLTSSILYLSSYFGVSEAFAIIGLTLIVRAALMPVSIAACLRTELNKERLLRVKPELDVLKEKWRGNRSQLAAAQMRVYKENDIRFFDGLTLVNIVSQSIFGLGLYRALVWAAFNSKFLWISSLAKPDALLTGLVALLMVLAMSVTPGAFAEPTMVVVLCVSVVVALFAVAAMPSAVGIYWATSNAASLIQSWIVRWLIRRRFVASA